MKTKHTPGPWQWYNSIGGRILRNARIRAGQRQTVATVHLQRTGDEEHANARLIAAAPDLIDALERLIHPMAGDDDLDHAREAVRKARGRV